MLIVLIWFLPRLMKTDLKGFRYFFLRQSVTSLLVLVYEDIDLLAAAQKPPISLSGLLKKLYFCGGGSAWSVIHLAYCQHKQNRYIFLKKHKKEHQLFPTFMTEAEARACVQHVC